MNRRNRSFLVTLSALAAVLVTASGLRARSPQTPAPQGTLVISAEDCIVETLSAVGSSGTQKSASHSSIVIVDKSHGSAG